MLRVTVIILLMYLAVFCASLKASNNDCNNIDYFQVYKQLSVEEIGAIKQSYIVANNIEKNNSAYKFSVFLDAFVSMNLEIDSKIRHYYKIRDFLENNVNFNLIFNKSVLLDKIEKVRVILFMYGAHLNGIEEKCSDIINISRQFSEEYSIDDQVHRDGFIKLAPYRLDLDSLKNYKITDKFCLYNEMNAILPVFLNKLIIQYIDYHESNLLGFGGVSNIDDDLNVFLKDGFSNYIPYPEGAYLHFFNDLVGVLDLVDENSENRQYFIGDDLDSIVRNLLMGYGRFLIDNQKPLPDKKLPD